jgi:hypothetical protein
MMTKFMSLATGVALIALTGTAFAAQPATQTHAKQPVALSDNQMDGVTAGGVGIANTGAIAIGEVDAVTFTQTSTNVNTALPSLSRIAIGQAFSQALAAGGFLYQAAAIAHADTQASLP